MHWRGLMGHVLHCMAHVLSKINLPDALVHDWKSTHEALWIKLTSAFACLLAFHHLSGACRVTRVSSNTVVHAAHVCLLHVNQVLTQYTWCLQGMLWVRCLCCKHCMPVDLVTVPYLFAGVCIGLDAFINCMLIEYLWCYPYTPIPQLFHWILPLYPEGVLDATPIPGSLFNGRSSICTNWGILICRVQGLLWLECKLTGCSVSTALMC